MLALEPHDYRMFFPEVDKAGGTFGSLLLPRSVKASAADREERGVRVTVAPQIARFAPPNACDVDTSSGEADVSPCAQVAPDTWRSSRNGVTYYIVRRDGVIVVLRGGGPAVSDSDLRGMPKSLTERKPAFFLNSNGIQKCGPSGVVTTAVSRACRNDEVSRWRRVDGRGECAVWAGLVGGG